MINRDFEHLNGLLAEFFSSQEIKQKLNIIDQYEISGWEVWLQIEFANLLSQTEHEWWREWTVDSDLRKKPDRPRQRTDFLLRKKGWTLDSYIGVEFKQNKNPASCIRNMFKDLEKLSKVKLSEIDMRSYWTVGITQSIDPDTLDQLVDKHISEKIYQTKTRSKHIHVAEIENTPYCYVII